MTNSLRLLLICVAFAVVGCVAFEDDLDRSYRSGDLTAADYHRLRLERDALRAQERLAQQEMFQRRQEEQQRVWETFELKQEAPLLGREPQRVGLGNQMNLSPATPKLPSGFALDQIKRGGGIMTGRSQFGADGKLWQEYRILDGTTYWRP
jgi:hypothetical protein